MRTKRVSGDDFHPRACSGRRSFKGFKKNRNPENVVVIDVDGDDQPDVVIIDVPDSFQQNLRGSSAPSKKRKVPHHKVISIDDEDSDVDHPGFADPGVSELDSDATSSKRSFPSPDILGNRADSVDQFRNIRAGKSSSKLSEREKSRRGKAPCKNRYGLSPELDDNLSGSDCSDCEVLEGSSEELRERWEKAYSKRKPESFSCRYGTEDQASTSTFHAGARANVRVDFRDGFCPGDPIYPFSAYDDVQENLSHGNNDDPNIWDNVDVRERESFQPDQENVQKRSQMKEPEYSVPVHGNNQVGQETFTDNARAHSQHGASSSNSMDAQGKDQYLKDAFGCSSVMGGDKANDHMGENSGVRETRNMGSSRPISPLSVNCGYEEPILHQSEVPGEANVPECSLSDDIDGIFQKEPCGNSSSPIEMHFEKAARCEKELGDQSMRKSTLSDEREVTNDKSEERDLFGKSTTNFPHKKHESAQGEPEHPTGRSCSVKDQDPDVTSISEPQLDEERGGECLPITQDSIINGREKLKETDEYRRAQEEEWASRQRQLQRQAEEAQRLRKRRKAERRILDMEKRQKQRLEEMRNTQKKDEENMTLKEQLRTEIRKELSKLEMSCIDMPSLLRGLGIHLGSSPAPLEVHSAYKRALLRFHPDRASRNDIRQQVEAEEKFKLISRMKEKFLLTSCH